MVQELVDAESAGVMFTADPGTGRRDAVLISAAWGLGEAVVGGLVNTDTPGGARADRDRSRQIADKAVQTVARRGGTTEVRCRPTGARPRSWTTPPPRELAGLGRRIAEHFGAPQDIEWARNLRRFPACSRGRSPPSPTRSAGADRVAGAATTPPYFRASIVEQLPDPLTPLFADLIDVAVTRSITA